MYNIFALSILVFINYISIYFKQLAEAYIILRIEHHQLDLNKIKIQFGLNFNIINIFLLYSVFLTEYFYVIIIFYKIYQIYQLNISSNVLKYNIIINFDKIISFYVLTLLYPFYSGLLFCFLDPDLIMI
jgi:hypothetical protein